MTLRTAFGCWLIMTLAAATCGTAITADIVVPTVEGDPMWHRYSYDGEKVLVLIDRRSDEFGSGEVSAEECSGLTPTSALPQGFDCVAIPLSGFPEAD